MPAPSGRPILGDVAPPRARSSELDGVRGLAILSVVLWHLTRSVSATAPLPARLLVRGLTLTWSGVDLFFVLSGFLIGGILLRNRAAANYFRVFYARRALRIVPLYAIWLAAFVLGTVAVPRLFDQRIALWNYATFTQNFAMVRQGTYGSNWLAVTWSLALEEQFYLVLPLLIRFVPPRRLPWVLTGGIAAAPLLRALAVLRAPTGVQFLTYMLLPFRLDALFLGTLLAWVLGNPTLRERLAARAVALHVGLATFALGGLALLARAPFHDEMPVTVFGYTWLAGTAACVLAIVSVCGNSPISALARWRPLCRLGVLAYAIYLTHQAILLAFHRLAFNRTAPSIADGRDLLVSLAAVAAAVALGAASWRALESRCIRYGHTHRYVFGQSSPVTRPAVAQAPGPSES
jgi:peptidoglycan/LPS O-acetylase OafA/YrhL